ncbi:hypothetical protein [Sporomusa acidovorans]|nr:hypothetical protein [Sporomusa acidovorans]
MKNKINLLIGCFVLLMIAAASLTACAQANVPPVSAGRQAAITIECQADVSETEAAVIERVAGETMRFFQEAGLNTKSLIQIILVRNRQAYLSKVMARFHISEIEAARAIKGTDAVAEPGRIIINMDGVPSDRQKTFLTAHETTHQVQRNLAGNQAAAVKWLLEGMVETAGAQVVDRMDYR